MDKQPVRKSVGQDPLSPVVPLSPNLCRGLGKMGTPLKNVSNPSSSAVEFSNPLAVPWLAIRT
jgi:hypothetical protein